MAVFDLFSKRQKRARGETPDVYVYDKLPQPLRVQIIHIIRDAFGEDEYGTDQVHNAYGFVKQTLCQEFGVFELFKYSRSDEDSIFQFFLQEESTERALDVVELCFKVITTIQYNYKIRRKIYPDDAVSELNERFKEHGVGYQFESGEIIRVDSEFLHAEAVKPTLLILHDKRFKGANEEFLKAHEHYRHRRYKECLVESLKAL